MKRKHLFCRLGFHHYTEQDLFSSMLLRIFVMRCSREGCNKKKAIAFYKAQNLGK